MIESHERSIPPLGVLEFDGDLTDKLIARGEVRRCEHWPCFHTHMWVWPKDEPRCGIVARTIGGPYTVLIAEQMAVCGMKAVVGLASAGRIGQALPLPGIAVEMQAASLFAFGQARGMPTGLVAHVTNAIDHSQMLLLRAMVAAVEVPWRKIEGQRARILATPRNRVHRRSSWTR